MKLQLRRIRKARGMSQQALADSLGITQTALSAWEIERNKINLDDACRVCDVLGCTLDELAGVPPKPRTMPPGFDGIYSAWESMNDVGRKALETSARALATLPEHSSKSDLDAKAVND